MHGVFWELEVRCLAAKGKLTCERKRGFGSLDVAFCC